MYKSINNRCNTHVNQEEICESCWRFKNKNCLNKMCDICCEAQCFKKYCPVHQQSIYISQSLKKYRVFLN